MKHTTAEIDRGLLVHRIRECAGRLRRLAMQARERGVGDVGTRLDEIARELDEVAGRART